jgi:hypothetical protein
MISSHFFLKRILNSQTPNSLLTGKYLTQIPEFIGVGRFEPVSTQLGLIIFLRFCHNSGNVYLRRANDGQ